MPALARQWMDDVFAYGWAYGSKGKALHGKDFAVAEQGRRAGDPAILLASSAKIKKELKWEPQFSKIEDIIETALRWHSSHPKGYLE